MVGIDILAHVAANFPQGVTPGGFSDVLEEIVKRGWLGDKSGQGFYKKSRGADGKEQRLVLDLKTFEYRPAAKAALPALEMAKNAATVQERLRMLLANDPAKDKAAAFLWPFLTSLWNFAADRIGEAAGDATVDRCGHARGIQLGAWGHLRCGMRRAWRTIATRMTAMGFAPSARVEAFARSRDMPAWYAKRWAFVLSTADRRNGASSGDRRARAGGGFQPCARGGPEQSRGIACGPGRRHWLHRAALAEERHRRRRGGDGFRGAESFL